MDEIDQPAQNRRIAVGQDAVAQVEDMARPARGAAQDIPRAGFGRSPASEHARRVEVALYSALMADALPRNVERLAGVDTHDVAARVGHQLEQGGGLRSEMDRRCT